MLQMATSPLPKIGKNTARAASRRDTTAVQISQITYTTLHYREKEGKREPCPAYGSRPAYLVGCALRRRQVSRHTRRERFEHEKNGRIECLSTPLPRTARSSKQGSVSYHETEPIGCQVLPFSCPGSSNQACCCCWLLSLVAVIVLDLVTTSCGMLADSFCAGPDNGANSNKLNLAIHSLPTMYTTWSLVPLDPTCYVLPRRNTL
ncbi:uncharacterized protein B0T23DRAFT_232510 [Neurospora hispaniola]|uniref:Uncharacterized protein n=1 Tax=Neurospora hispaniola TaxID=588809 RepID=A0AAJ0MMX0_9PEZI|nr:hypothetical protein B0T23DRAFT_232510 [Neurospora hispaniola]